MGSSERQRELRRRREGSLGSKGPSIDSWCHPANRSVGLEVAEEAWNAVSLKWSAAKPTKIEIQKNSAVCSRLAAWTAEFIF